MRNAYPEKPVLQYKKTSIEMAFAIQYIKESQAPAEVKRAAYIFFRMESANGKSGVNNNYAGIQADGARWPAEFDKKIAGTVVKRENGTGKERIFIAFHSWKDSIDFTISNSLRRELYIGGLTWKYTQIAIKNPRDLCTAYKREWVTGDPEHEPSEQNYRDFESMYKQAARLFV
ncbi:hypothetical protein AAHN97_14930 [Chitinophaga niabensis]|uniref:hypothetical protein n=1 Tax=Chitinophaga niabensis TaxID=536979 RepID=UPI0031BAE5DA